MTLQNINPHEHAEALRQCEERLRLVTDAAELGLWTWQPDGDRISWDNDRPYAILGMARTEAPLTAARFAEEFVHPEDLADFKQAIAHTVQNGVRLFYQGRIHRPDGALRWIEFTGVPVQGPDGACLRMPGTVQDITERRRAEETACEAQERLHFAANAARLTYVEVDVVKGGARSADNFAAVMGYAAPSAQETDASVGVHALLEHVVPEDRARVQASVEAFISGKPPGKIDYRVLGDDQVERWIESSWSLEHNASGELLKTFATNIDITERKRAELALRESEAFSRSIINSSPDCIKVLDLEGNLLSMQSGQELLGIEDIQPFLNTSWIDFWEDADGKRAAQAAVESAAAGGAGNFVGFFRTLRGEAKWWDVAISPILDADGQPARLLAVSRDVTQRQQAEEALRQRTAQFETLVNQAPLGVYLIDADFRVRQVNPTALPAFGNIPELIGRDFAGVMHILWPQTQADEVIQKFRHTLETGEPCFVPELIEKRADRQTTEYYEWQINRIPLPDGRHGVVCYFRDISQRVLARQKIRDSEERYRGLFNSMDEGFCIIEIIFDEEEQAVDYRFLEVNPAFEKQTGVPDPTGKRMLEVSPDQDPPALEIYRQIVLTGEPFRFVNEAKAVGRYFDAYAFLVGGLGSRKIAVVFNNITERKAAEEALRVSEQEFRHLAEAMPQIVWVTKSDGWNIYFNQQWVDYTGMTMEESHGHGWNTPFHPDDQQPAWEAWQRAVQLNEPYSLECRLRRADGVYRWWLIRGVPMRSANGEIQKWFGTCTDIEDLKQAEEALRESGERYRNLFNSIDEGFCVIDMIFDEHQKAVDYRFLEVNPAFEKQTGMHDATGKRMRELVPDIEAHWIEIYGQVALTGESIRFVNEAKAMDGRWFDVYACRVGGPESSRVAILFSDITERKQAEQALEQLNATLELRVAERAEALRESEKRLRFAMRSANVGLWDWDLATNAVVFSPEWKSQIGYAADEIPDRFEAWQSCVHPDDVERTLQKITDFLANPQGRYEVEFRLRHKDGSYRWIYSEGNVMRDAAGQPMHMLGCHIDITERKQAEAHLRELNDTLERRVLERTQALGESEMRQKRATDAAVTANQAKSDFLSTMSHEIRTPLNGMLGMTELLLTEPLTPQQRQYAELAHSSGKTLLALVNDLLDIGKIEAGRLDVEHIPFSLTELLSELTDLYTLRAHEKSLKFLFKKALGVPKTLLGDPGHLRQILNNLLANALKFTHQGEIGLSVERLGGDGHACRLRFSVHDSGIGIAPDMQPRLFTRFTQVDSSSTSEYGGSGLGLAIVKQLCEHLGGAVALASTPGQGSVFSCDLPFAEVEQAVPVPVPVPVPVLRQTRILMVEDNPINQIVARAQLQTLGYADVTAVDNGQEAVDAVIRGGFDLVLMDCRMPVLDGYAATEQIRARGYRLPIIAMTANAASTERDKCLKLGMNDYMAKPFNIAILRETLARWLP